MANLSELIRQKEQQTEEWKQRKADERDSLNDMNDAAALRVTESAGAFLHYLDVQADNPRFSASNVLLTMEQNPEVTVFNSVKGWNGLNRNVMREEVGMKIRVGDTYVRDGRQYRGYKVGRVFDISQTTGRGQPAKPAGGWQRCYEQGAVPAPDGVACPCCVRRCPWTGCVV